MVMISSELLIKLLNAFPDSFVNSSNEFIACRKINSYFGLNNVDEKTLKCKVLEWLSHPAHKGGTGSRKRNEDIYDFHLNGINKFLGTDFSRDDIERVYIELGNEIDRDKTLRFIDSGYDMAVL